MRPALFFLGLLGPMAGCYQSHGLSSIDTGAPSIDAGPPVRRDTGAPRDAGACDLSRVSCSALPCLGERPPETIYCDDVRICLSSDPGGVMASAIASVADRIQCMPADSCDFLCFMTDGRFDDEVRSELCAITRVAPSAEIDCAIYGP